MTLAEEFRIIDGFPDYMIGNYGTICRISLRKEVPQHKMKGYNLVNLRTINGKMVSKLTHRLVAEAFLPKIEGKDYVDHIDGTRDNNCVSNLRWCTFQENCSFPLAIERRKQAAMKGWSKPVVQYDKRGNKIARFCCIKEAEIKTGINHSNISRVCMGKRKSAGNFVWKYE